jgi:hypothetical protein
MDMPFRWSTRRLARLHNVLVVVLGGIGCQPSHAQAWQWQGSAGVLSDKVAYGISQSGGSASAVVDLKLSRVDGWLIGAGVASLPTERGGAEANLLAGRSAQVGDHAWQATFGAFAPLGPGPLRVRDYLQAGLGYAWNDRLQLNVWLVPNLLGPSESGGTMRGRVVAVEAGWQQPIGRGVALNAGVGQIDFGPLALPGYRYGSVGVRRGCSATAAHRTPQARAPWSRCSSTSEAPRATAPAGS